MAKQKVIQRGFGQAAIYARVSTDEQASSGLGVDAQINACRQMAALRGWEVNEEHIFVDAGVSGTLTPERRAQMGRLLAHANEGDFSTVIIFSLDRLARKTTYILDFVETLSESDIAVTFVREQAIDTASAAGRVVMGVLAAFAQFERDLISERTRDAIAQKQASGWRAGRLPYGYSQGTGGAVIDQGKAQVVQRIFKDRAAGDSYGKIANGLNSDNVAAPHGKRWYASSVREIVINNEAAYRGEDELPAIL